MKTKCGADCAECTRKEKCKGCSETNSCPFGKKCFISEYIELGGIENLEKFKQTLIDEFNSLNVAGMPVIDQLHILPGEFVNLAYPLPSGENIKFLDDNDIYLGNQVECAFSGERCFGLVANPVFLLVVEYGENGINPEILVYKKR